MLFFLLNNLTYKSIKEQKGKKKCHTVNIYAQTDKRLGFQNA